MPASFTEAGKLKPDAKAGVIVKWLKDDFDLGHGHAMAIYAFLNGAKSKSGKWSAMLRQHASKINFC